MTKKITSLIFESPDLNPLDYHVRGAIMVLHTCQNRPTLPSLRLPCYRYGMICHRSSLITSKSSILCCCNTQFKYRDSSWLSLLKRLKLFTEKLSKVWFVI